MRLTGRLLFLAYILILIYLLFFAEWYQHGPGIREIRRYNFTPFAEISRFITHTDSLGMAAVLANLAGNMIGFVPVGFILPVMDRSFAGVIPSVLTGCFLSILVELTQFFTRLGICDVDDVILNTFGTLLGYFLFLCMRRVRRHRIYAKRSKI